MCRTIGGSFLELPLPEAWWVKNVVVLSICKLSKGFTISLQNMCGSFHQRGNGEGVQAQFTDRKKVLATVFFFLVLNLFDRGVQWFIYGKTCSGGGGPAFSRVSNG